MSAKIQYLLGEAERESDGKSSVTCASRDFASNDAAANAFELFRQKLYNVNGWEIESGVSAFQLFDENGGEIESQSARVGNFIRIHLPGSGKKDWVKISDIHDSSDESIITVQPTYDPTEKKIETGETSHFFTSDSRNNFCLKKDDTKLRFYVIGLHEKPNVSETGSLLEKARNVATAGFGWLGFQKIEWKTFCENFLKSEKRTM